VRPPGPARPGGAARTARPVRGIDRAVRAEVVRRTRLRRRRLRRLPPPGRGRPGAGREGISGLPPTRPRSYNTLMSRFVAWLLVALSLAAFAAVTVGALRERAAAGQGMPPYSVYSEAGDGLGEAAHLLRRLGWGPVALTRPPQSAQHQGLLVLLGPAR